MNSFARVNYAYEVDLRDEYRGLNYYELYTRLMENGYEPAD